MIRRFISKTTRKNGSRNDFRFLFYSLKSGSGRTDPNFYWKETAVGCYGNQIVHKKVHKYLDD